MATAGVVYTPPGGATLGLTLAANIARPIRRPMTHSDIVSPPPEVAGGGGGGGGGPVAVRGTTPAVASTTANPISVSLTGARQPQAGDCLVIIHGNNFYTAAAMPTPTVGGSSSGVTAITGGSADNGTDLAHIKSYTYAVASTGDLTVSVTETGSGDEEKVLVVYVLPGVDPTTPIDTAQGTANGLTQSSLVLTGVSPSTSDAFLIYHVNNGGGSASGSPYGAPGTSTELYDAVTGGITYTGGIEQLSASGATGTRTVTPNSPVTWAGVLIAVQTAPAAGGASPAPDNASGSGAAFDAVADVDANAAEASGSGAAQTPAAAAAGNAAEATGAGTAHDVTVSTVSAATATPAEAAGVGTANAPTTAAAGNAAAATGAGTAEWTAGSSISVDLIQDNPVDAAGTAYNATVSTASAANPTPAEAAGTGTAPAPTAAVAITATEAAGAGSAAAPAAAAAPNAGTTTGTGAAQPPTASVEANPAAAAGTSTAADASLALQLGATEATGAGTAYDATVSTAALTNANAQEATATGTAQTAATTVAANAAEAVAAGAAIFDAGSIISVDLVQDLPVEAVGTAFNATVSTLSVTNAPAGAAVGAGTAGNPTVALTVFAGTTVGAGVAGDPVAGVPGAAFAQSATATATAYQPRQIRKLYLRPNTGTTARPTTGRTSRPYAGTTPRP